MLVAFSADGPEDYYDSKMKLSIISLSYIYFRTIKFGGRGEFRWLNLKSKNCAKLGSVVGVWFEVIKSEVQNNVLI